jgi:hypothetical protein
MSVENRKQKESRLKIKCLPGEALFISLKRNDPERNYSKRIFSDLFFKCKEIEVKTD